METINDSAQLIDCQPADYPQLIDWIDSDELNYLWGGPKFDYPLTIEQLQQHYGQHAARPFLFFIDKQLAGFIELYRVCKVEHRICRVLICPAHRGKGYAAIMMKLAIKKAQEQYQAQRLSLRVFAHNQAAISCYQTLGFNTDEVVKDAGNGNGWVLVYMSLCLE
ncbi:GNAT family N-acetyltransferase [Vibrio ostreicida]|uniref:GNAT family N-acetyltransferase n=1 Tax=Vibrio ostreicida TaxID=526588 RepID=UPI000970AAA7|nr:GNAT family protein [Vibrio ostreicida]